MGRPGEGGRESKGSKRIEKLEPENGSDSDREIGT